MTAHKLLIVNDGLVADGMAEGSYLPHPALYEWQRELEGYRVRWFRSGARMAVEWYAELTGSTLGQLFSQPLDRDMPAGFSQLWVASPFHASLARDRLRVMPDALFPWSESDAVWLCDLLHPLLSEGGMQLMHHRSLLFLLCRQPLQASPLSFAAVSGQTLPNRHPEGADAGALMRLTAEIQMVLRQHPAEQRRAASEPDVDGLWFWGGCPIRDESAVNTLPVATRNPMLRAMTDARDAGVIITEAERLQELVQSGRPLPKQVLLAGGGHALLLSKTLLPKFGKTTWQPKSVKSEVELLSLLRGIK